MNAPSSNAQIDKALGGFVNRKLRWSLSLKGWCVLLLMSLVFCVFFVRGVHPFLAVQKPVPARVLVVEGWMADYDIPAVVAEFRRGNYQTMYTTGGAIHWKNSPETYADYSAQALQNAGIPANSIVPVPCAGNDW